MLMCLGPVTFTIKSGLDTVESEWQAAYAKHDVIKASPVYEAMGQEESRVTINGVLHPSHFGFQGTIAGMIAIKDAQTPVPLMRGDFVPLGWYIIESVSRTDSEIDAYGTGREIQFSVSLLRTGAPGISMAASILRLFN